MFKVLKNEFKEIKWPVAKDVVKQSLFSIGVIIITASTFLVYETGIQKLISLIIS